MSTYKIHPTAIVHKDAEIGEEVEIGPYCVISAQAKIGKKTILHSHVVIDGITTIGENNQIFPFSVIGGPPQDFSYKNEPTRVEIGNNNVFREGVSIHRGTMKDIGLTKLGNNNFVMAYCHFAHDSMVGDHLIMANQSATTGHGHIGNHVTIGGQSGLGPKVRVGDYAFIGGASAIRRDLPPYMCAKEFSQVTGPNIVGLKRNGMNEEEIRVACELYKIMYLGNLTTEKAVQEIEKRYEGHPVAKRFTDFIRGTRVGIQR